MKKTLLIFALFIIISGCFPASFKTLTFPDPAFKGNTYSKMCVACYINDDAYLQQLYEKSFKEEFFKAGVYIEESIRLFPPTREWTDEKIHEELIRLGYDSYLLITTREGYTVTDYIPAKKTIETKKKTESKKEDDDQKKEKDKDEDEVIVEQTTIKETPAHITENYYVTIEIKLIDVKRSGTAWVSYLKSNQGRGLNFESLYNESRASKIAESTLEHLAKDGFINIPKDR